MAFEGQGYHHRRSIWNTICVEPLGDFVLLGLGISTLFISVIAGIRLCLNKRHAKKMASRFDDIYCSSASISDIAYNQCRPGGFAGDEENMLKNVRNILHER